MRLSDIMSAMELSVYPQVALVIFLGVFAAVVLRTFARGRKNELEKLAMLPLEDGMTEDRP